MGIDSLLERIRERQANGPNATEGPWAVAAPALLTGDSEPLYHHHNPTLAIDFQVQRLPLSGLQVLDPRLVRIAPGARNESHRHAHESLSWCSPARGSCASAPRPCP